MMAKTLDDRTSSSSSSQQLSAFSGNREVSLIDRNLVEVPELISKYNHLVSINLHGNNIGVLRGLDHLANTLRFLDVSSNRLASMNGLGNLHELVYLNLASNRLTSVGSLSKLHNLRYINLAYNRITGLAGFRQLALSNMGNCALERVDLHANSMSSVDLVIAAFCEFTNLHELYFAKDGASNPVCSVSSYRGRVLAALGQLSVLDGSDRYGNPIVDNGWLQQEDIMSDLVLSLIDSNFVEKREKSPSRPGNSKSINTPHVDAVLERIRKGQQRELDKADTKAGSRINFAVDGSENEDVVTAHASPTISPTVKKTVRIDEPEENKANKMMALYETRLKEMESEISRLKSSVGQQSAALINASTQNRSTEVGVQAQEQPPTHRGHHSHQQHRQLPASSKREADSDAEQRREAAKTFGDLVRQIEGERERRFKAEVAAKKLADAVKVMEDRLKQFQDFATVTEMEHTGRLKAEEEVKRLGRELSEANSRLPQLDGLLQKSNSESTRLKGELDQSNMKLLVAERRIMEMETESKRLQSQATDLERRLVDVQATLAAREAEHRREASGRDYTDRIAAIEMLWKERLDSEKRHTEEWTSKYRHLEDEFRDALRIEAGRFEAVEEELRRTSEEDRKLKAALKTTEQRLVQHQQASAQLTSVVKSLKTKLAESEKTYTAKVAELESRVIAADRELAESRKQAQAADLLRQEKVKLIAELQALQSIVEGLRSERKHWGEELAKQGAQLSGDRGRLESRIESLALEAAGLRRELDKEAENVKIKAKIIDDQLDTIRKLKDALVDREKQLKEARSECLDLQKQVEERDVELKESAEALETSDRRSSELKKRAVDLQQQLVTERQARQSESEKWRERIAGIGELESRVIDLQKNSQEKEKQLHEDKTKLAVELETARERVRVLDDRFREQLDLTQIEHARTLERVRSEAANEVAKAQSRVRQVEDEMRTLLSETETQKRAMEARVKQLQAGLSQLVGFDVSTTQKQQAALGT